jgi:TonB family protein
VDQAQRLCMTAALALLPAASVAGATPTGVKPAVSPGTWVTSEDYPVSALRAGIGGKTGFRLAVDTQGHVSGCAITHSSGNAALDTATCALLSARAQFVPATDRHGDAIASTYMSSVRWQIPDNSEAMLQSHFESCIAKNNEMIVVESAFGCAF